MLSKIKAFIILFGLVTVVSLSSCKLAAPTIKSLDAPRAERVGTTGVSITSNVVLHNPNPVRIRVKSLNLSVLLNNKNIGSIGQSNNIFVKRDSDFSIPLSINIQSLESLFGDLKSIFGMLQNKDWELKVDGDLHIRAYWVLNYKYNLEKTQKITLPKLK